MYKSRKSIGLRDSDKRFVVLRCRWQVCLSKTVGWRWYVGRAVSRPRQSVVQTIINLKNTGTLRECLPSPHTPRVESRQLLNAKRPPHTERSYRIRILFVLSTSPLFYGLPCHFSLTNTSCHPDARTCHGRTLHSPTGGLFVLDQSDDHNVDVRSPLYDTQQIVKSKLLAEANERQIWGRFVGKRPRKRPTSRWMEMKCCLRAPSDFWLASQHLQLECHRHNRTGVSENYCVRFNVPNYFYAWRAFLNCKYTRSDCIASDLIRVGSNWWTTALTMIVDSRTTGLRSCSRHAIE